MGYHGTYIEDLINMANETMINKLIEKGSEVKRKLLTLSHIHQISDDIKDALSYLKKSDPIRYKRASKYLKGDCPKDKLDLFLAIDDILLIKKDEDDLWVGIDWTTDLDSDTLLKKINNHKKLKHCHYLVGLDYSIVVLLTNVDAIPKGKEAKFLFRALKAIAQKVKEPNFQGGMTIDAKAILK